MMKRALLPIVLLLLAAPASAAFLGGNSRLGEKLLDASSLHVASGLSSERLPSSDEVWLRRAAECFVAPGGSGGALTRPQRVFTTTDAPVNLSRPKGTFVTEIDISAPESLVPHVQRNVPPSAARPGGSLPRYVTEIEVPQGSVLPDPTVPYRPNTGTGWVPSGTQGARVRTTWEVIEDAFGRPTLRKVK
jgi:hypothetical protein